MMLLLFASVLLFVTTVYVVICVVTEWDVDGARCCCTFVGVVYVGCVVIVIMIVLVVVCVLLMLML